MANDYERKQEARRARLEARAEKLRTESAARFKRADSMAEAIPFGQPILVGHHSEGRDRRYRARIHDNMDKGVQLARAAERTEQRAAAVGSGGISSDDPEAVTKLRAELASAEELQRIMNEANKIVRAFVRAKHTEADADAWALYVGALGAVNSMLTESKARELLRADFAGRIGFPDYALSNNGANVRRIKERIERLQQLTPDAPDVDTECKGYTVRQNHAANRLQVIFPGKPPEAVRQALRACGYRWSPTEGAWQRMLSANAFYYVTDPEGYLRKQIEGAL